MTKVRTRKWNVRLRFTVQFVTQYQTGSYEALNMNEAESLARADVLKKYPIAMDIEPIQVTCTQVIMEDW